MSAAMLTWCTRGKWTQSWTASEERDIEADARLSWLGEGNQVQRAAGQDLGTDSPSVGGG